LDIKGPARLREIFALLQNDVDDTRDALGLKTPASARADKAWKSAALCPGPLPPMT